MLRPQDVLFYTITAPHFRAQFILHNGHVVATKGPIRFLIGQHLMKVMRFCDFRGWIFEQVKVQ